MHAFGAAKDPLFGRTAFMSSDVLEMSVGTGTVFLHQDDPTVTFVTSHVFAFERKTLLNSDLLPLRSVIDFANLY